MATKKESRRMIDMLERMHMIKKEEDGAAAVEKPEPAPEAEAPVPQTLAAPEAFEAEPAQTAAPDMFRPVAGVTEREIYAPAPVLSYEKRTVTTGPSLTSLGDNFWDDTPAEPEPVEHYMEIDELYQLFQMQVHGVETVYLLEEYIKTLPDSLPADLRRNIIVRIVQASGFDFDRLLSDGIDRVSRLNDYAAEFAARTDAIVTQQNETIAELERQIELVRAVISERKNLHKKQFLGIENEAQRLKKILDFITK